MKSHLLLSLPILAASLLAQYTGEPPVLVTPSAPYAPLGAVALGLTAAGQVAQVRLIPDASVAGYTHYCAATVKVAAGPRWILQSGRFNIFTGAYAINTDIDACVAGVPAGDLFALAISNDLKTAAFDASTGVRWATRPGTSGSFTLQPAVVTGIVGTYVDPNFGSVGGSDVLLFASGANSAISFAKFSAGAVGAATKVAGGALVHSPTPVSDKTGEMRGVMYMDASGSPYKAMFASILAEDVGIPAKAFFTSSPGWIANGDCTGGTITLATAPGATYTDPLRMGISAVNSSTLPALAPSVLNITSWGPVQPAAATPYIGVTLLGPLAGGPITPGGIVVGNLSLASVALLPTGVFDNTSGTYVQTFALPPLPALKIYCQTALCDIGANKIYLSNTGKIEFK
jgi:hypothetical protein